LADQSGDLFIVRRPTTGAKVVIEMVGRLDKGIIRIDSAKKDSLLEGRPVYLAVP
jgi:hypothetical protein